MRGFYFAPNDYISMRIISDELYARLVKELAKNEAVAIFQQLILSPKKDEETEAKEESTETSQEADK